jgi:cytochrome P450
VREVLVGSNRAFRKGPTMQAAKRMIGDSLLTTEGEEHRRQRRLIQPLFHHERIAGYADDMVELADRTADRWRDGLPLDAHAEMGRLTLAVVSRTLFGTDLPAGESRAITGALSGTLAQFDRVFSPLLPITERLPLPATRRFRAAHETFDRLVYGLIGRRRAEGAIGDDLLSMLLRAQDAGAGMSDTQVRDEAITLFLAGHETTSNALTWTWYLLSGNPDVRRAWHAELDEVIGDRPPAAIDLARLPLTDAVLHEAIRLYPPAWAMGRTALEVHHAGGSEIPAGATVVVSPWLLHRDARWFPDPSAFRPDRWPAGPEPRHAYLPFGAGPRMCIGEPFAWMEAALLLATIGRRWELELSPDARVDLQPVVTLRPRHGMAMIARPRRAA